MEKRRLVCRISASLMAIGLVAGAPAHASELSPETTRADEGRQGDREPVTDESGRQLYTVYLDEALVEKEDDSREAPARKTSDERNTYEWRGWHRAKARASVRRLEREYRLEAVSMTSYIMPTFSAYLSPERVRELGADERVTKLEPVYQAGDDFSAVWADQQGSGACCELIPWGKIAIGTNDALTTSNAVYMLDGDEQSHIDLVNMQVAPVNPSYTSAPGHANHVAGILSAKASNGYAVRGVNPSAPVISVHKGVSDAETQAALDWILADSEGRGAYGVVNISSSSSRWKSTGALGPWVKRLSARALVVQAAGNQNANACGYAWDVPELNDGILVVGGIDEDGARAIPFDNTGTGYQNEPGSSYGSCVEAWAPAQRIYSTWNTSVTSMQRLSGTSMAAPHVAAFAARFGGNASTPVQREYFVRSKLMATGYTDPNGYGIKIPSYPLGSAAVPNLLSPVAVSASSTVAGSSPSYAVDRLYADGARVWNSGGPAPAWIEFDLGTARSLKAIRLTPEQSPQSGTMTHYIYAGNTSAPTTLVATINGTTTSRQPIIRNINATGRYVRVLTTASSSWVAWREIELYGF